jgi:nucleotide-binding universal stress UspA family protein
MKLLLTIDDSKFSEATTQVVIAQAKPRETEVRVLHVIEPPMIAGDMAAVMDFPALMQELRKRGEALLAQAANALRTAGFEAVSATMEGGHPKSVIVDFAAKWPADLIVMGSHGRTGLNRFLLGSVSEAVVRHAHCSVLIVRSPQLMTQQATTTTGSI